MEVLDAPAVPVRLDHVLRRREALHLRVREEHPVERVLPVSGALFVDPDGGDLENTGGLAVGVEEPKRHSGSADTEPSEACTASLARGNLDHDRSEKRGSRHPFAKVDTAVSAP